MQFSNTTTKGGILQRCELNLSLPDGAITGDATLLAYFTGLANETYNELFTEILASQDSWDFDDSNHTDFAIATTPFIASQRDYKFATTLEILKIKRMDVTYDGSTYVPCNPVDSSEFNFGIGNATNEDTNFSKDSPAYDVKADSIWIYPLPNATDVAAGGEIRLEFSRDLDDFATTDTTQEPGIDRPFHDLIPLGASMKYAIIKNMDNAKNLKSLFDERLFAMKGYYARKQEDKDAVLLTPYEISDYS